MLFRKAKPVATIHPLTEQTLRQWLVEALAQKLSEDQKHSVDPAEVDTSINFEDYGLDSRTAIQMSGRLEKVLERRLSPALFFNYPTIDSLVKHLSQELGLEQQEQQQ